MRLDDITMREDRKSYLVLDVYEVLSIGDRLDVCIGNGVFCGMS